MKHKRRSAVVASLVLVLLGGLPSRLLEPVSVTSAQTGCFEDDRYLENFDAGSPSAWYLGPGFQIVNEGSGKIPQGVGASSAIATYLFGDYWTDSTFRFKLTLNAGEFRASLRYNTNSVDLVYDRILGKPSERYYVQFTSSSVLLGRTKGGTDSTLASTATSFVPSQSYAVKVVVAGGTLSVYVNDTLVLTATDSQPVPSGSIALETKSNAQVKVDDIEVVASVPCEHTWAPTPTSPLGGDANVIVSDPADANVVYAGMEHQGLWKSTDGGLTWAEVGYAGDMARLGKVYTIVVAPSNTDVVYAGYARDVDKSTDGGLHWTRTALINTQTSVNGLVVDPRNPDVVYAALGEYSGPPGSPGVFKSSDGGVSWSRSGFTSAALAIAIVASAPDTLFVASTDGIYKSTDAGSTWTKVYDGVGQRGSFSAAVDPVDANRVYATIGAAVRSTDGGTTWTTLRSSGTRIVVAPSNSNVAYLLDGSRILKSTDRGDTWNSGGGLALAASITKTIAVDSANADKLYVGTHGQGIFFSLDGGATYAAPAIRSVPADLGAAIIVDPSNENRIYAGTVFGEVYVSNDRAASWTRLVILGAGGPQSLITGLLVDPLTPSTIYASNIEGVYKSTDSGTSWKTITSGMSDTRIISLALDPQNPGRLFAGTGSGRPRNTSEGTGMYASTNGGESWTKISGLPDAPVPAIAISPADTSKVYAAVMTAGVYRSLDGGSTWAQVKSGFQDLCVYTLAVDPTNASIVYAGTTGNSTYCKTFSSKPDHVYKTENGGADWKVVLEGKTIYDTIEGIVVDPSNPKNVYVANHTEKVWFSADAGATWARADKGVVRHGAHLYLWAMAASPSGSTFYIITCGRGVLRNDVKTSETSSRRGGVDLDGDGKADAFLYNAATGAWGDEISSGGGTFTSSASGRWDAGWSVFAADFNLDAFGDLFLYSLASGVWVKAYGTASGGRNYISGTWSPSWSVYVLDLDGDRRSDIFLYNVATGARFKCIHDPTTGDFSRYYAGTWSPQWSLYPADWNGDGKGDFFLYYVLTGLWFRATNDGGADFTYYSESWAAAWSVYPGDFNGDGKTDLFLYHPTTGQWFICTNTGVTFSYVTGTWAGGWTVNIADFDGNGKADVHLYNSGNGQWFECVTNAAGNFTYYTGTTDLGRQVFITDLNGDGKSDVLFYSGRTWTQALNTSLGAFAYGSGTWDTNLTVVATSTKLP